VLHGEGTADLAHGIATVDDDRRTALGDNARAAPRVDAIYGKLLHVVGDAQHSVRMDAAEIGVDQAFGKKRGILIRHAAAEKNCAHDKRQPPRQYAPVGFTPRVDGHGSVSLLRFAGGGVRSRLR
jgi:hypothetical protein